MLLQLEILWPALVAGLLVLLTHVPLGREVLHRGIIFLDLAIAQIAAFGVIVVKSFLFHDSGHTIQTLIAIIFAIAAAVGLFRLRRLEVRVQEAIIGILFILAATGSILVLAADPHGGERLKAILVGQILWLQPVQLIPLAIIYIAVLIGWLSLRARFGDWLFYPLFAITITLSTQVVGVYLVFASLIIPAIVTLHRSRPLLKGFAIGALGYLCGLLLAAFFDLPAGAAIVWSIAISAAAYWVICSLFVQSKRVDTDIAAR